MKYRLGLALSVSLPLLLSSSALANVGIETISGVAGGIGGGAGVVGGCDNGSKMESPSKWSLYVTCDLTFNASTSLIGGSQSGSTALVDLTSTFSWNPPVFPGDYWIDDVYVINRRFDGQHSYSTSTTGIAGAIAAASIAHQTSVNPPGFNTAEMFSKGFIRSQDSDFDSFEFVNFSRSISPLYPSNEITLGGYIFGYAYAEGIGFASSQARITFTDTMEIEWFPGLDRFPDVSSFGAVGVPFIKALQANSVTSQFNGSLEDLETIWGAKVDNQVSSLKEYLDGANASTPIDKVTVPEPISLLSLFGIVGLYSLTQLRRIKQIFRGATSVAVTKCHRG